MVKMEFVYPEHGHQVFSVATSDNFAHECSVSADTHARYGCTFFLVLDYQSNTTQFLTKIWYKNKSSPKALVQ